MCALILQSGFPESLEEAGSIFRIRVDRVVFHMGDGKPDVMSTVIADLAEPKFLGIIPQVWHPQYAKLELEKATITFEGYVSCSTFEEMCP